MSHKEFRLNLAWNLVTSGWSEGENNNDENIPSKSSFTRNKPGQHLPKRGP
ncbi:4657_t:CDS:1 [Entrophospora sp. SA101]|nr:4657_t:CDS:1 [Entrophospora sp. SA101]